MLTPARIWAPAGNLTWPDRNPRAHSKIAQRASEAGGAQPIEAVFQEGDVVALEEEEGPPA